MAWEEVLKEAREMERLGVAITRSARSVRNAAVRDAIDTGATQATIAGHLDVGRQRVAQMADPEWQSKKNRGPKKGADDGGG